MVFPLLALIVLLAGCAPRIPDLPPEEIVRRAAERMRGLQGFQFRIDRSGAPAYIDYAETLSLTLMEGAFAAPDKLSATVRVIAPALIAEIDVICIGQQQWETDVVTHKWFAIPPEWGFNPLILLDPQFGLQTIIASDLYDLTLDGVEELEEMPGRKLYALSGRMHGGTIYDLSYQLIGPEDMDVRLWVDPQTFDLYRTVLVEYPGVSEEEIRWTIDFWDFDVPVEIEAPNLE